MSDTNDKKKSNLIGVGYVMSIMPILILPIIFVPAGVGVGIANIAKEETGHGIAQIVLAVLTGVVGVAIGGAGFYL